MLNLDHKQEPLQNWAEIHISFDQELLTLSFCYKNEEMA